MSYPRYNTVDDKCIADGNNIRFQWLKNYLEENSDRVFPQSLCLLLVVATVWEQDADFDPTQTLRNELKSAENYDFP